MKALVYGAGATGARAARQLLAAGGIEDLVLADINAERAKAGAESLGEPARAVVLSSLRADSRSAAIGELAESVDVVILSAVDDHVRMAQIALDARSHVVSVSDDVETCRELAELDDDAARAGKTVVIGAGFSPGLTCLLARHGATWLDSVDEIHVAKFGTGGPECARQHHRALCSDSMDWLDGKWVPNRGGSGRELYWFPDPVGGLDCYRAQLPDPQLMVKAFPALSRSTARVAATRRDRSTKWLPMLRRPHPEGLIGAVRVELRGALDAQRNTVVLGVLDRPAVAAGTVAAVAARWTAQDRFRRLGAAGLAELVDNATPFLHELAERGVRAAVFEGQTSPRVAVV